MCHIFGAIAYHFTVVFVVQMSFGQKRKYAMRIARIYIYKYIAKLFDRVTDTEHRTQITLLCEQEMQMIAHSRPLMADYSFIRI